MEIFKELNAIYTVAIRDITKYLRDGSRLVISLIFPLIFIGVLGTSLSANLSESAGYNLLLFTFVGVMAQTLFQSTAMGIMSLIEDRQNDFAQELFVTPVSRVSILIGKIFGESLVSYLQVLGIILIGFIIGIPMSFTQIITTLIAGLVIALFGGSFGVMVLGNFLDQKTASQFFPFIMFPQMFLSGIFNPIKNLPWYLSIASKISPMTYAIDLIRNVFYFNSPVKDQVVLFTLEFDLFIILLLTLIFLSVGTIIFIKKQRNL